MNNRRISSSEFIKAAQKGDMTVIEPYIAKNRNDPVAINATNQNGKTALIWAAQNGNTAVVQALLTAPGINLDAADQNGQTALIWAAYKGHTDIVQILIDAKAKIDTTSQNGGAALILAADQGHTTIVQTLVNAGVKIDTTYQNSYTALMYAANNGHIATVQALTDSGAKIDQYIIVKYTFQTSSYEHNSKTRKTAKIILTAKINSIHKQRLANSNKPQDIINALTEQTKYEHAFLEHIYRELFKSYTYDNQQSVALKKMMSLAKHLYEGRGYDPVEAVRFLTNDLDAMPDDVKALASDILAHLERKKKPSIYISAIEQALNELKNDIASAEFSVKDIKGNWVAGKPRHIATIESTLNRQRKTWADTLGAYSKVMTLLDTEASIFQKSRHPNTTLFYKDSLEKLRGIRYDGSNSCTPMPPSYEDHMKIYPDSYEECMRSYPASAAAAAAAINLSDLPPPTYANSTTPAAATAAAASPAPANTYNTQTFAAMFPPVPTDALPALPSEKPAEKRMLSA